MIRHCLSTKGLARSHGLSKASGTAQGSSHRSLERVHASGHGTEGGGAMHSDGYNLTVTFKACSTVSLSAVSTCQAMEGIPAWVAWPSVPARTY